MKIHTTWFWLKNINTEKNYNQSKQAAQSVYKYITNDDSKGWFISKFILFNSFI
jgi:hypothetical protein